MRTTWAPDEFASLAMQRGFLSTLPGRAGWALVGRAIRIDVPAGAVVYRNDETPRLIIVVTGLLRVFLSSFDGRQVTVRYVRSGDVAGLALVVGGPGPMNIQAMTAASVLSLRVDDLRQLLATDPAVARACAEELTRQLYRVLQDLSDQSFLTVRQRLARRLLDLAALDEGLDLVVHASQQDLADAIGSVREVVTRTLGEMRSDGLIDTARDEIALLDPLELASEIAPEGAVDS